jgi:DNA-binding NarL/FixJ family response regulator
MDIYIVDDAPLPRERLAAALSEIAGARVVGEAGSVSAAIAGLGHLRPELVILDIRLPDGTGFDLLDWLRIAQPEARVLLISGESYPQYRRRAHQSGAEFFDKTREFEQLRAAVAALVEAAEHERQH